MERDRMVDLIQLGYSHRKMSNALNVSESTIRHWLSKYGLKTQNNRYGNKNKNVFLTSKKCGLCRVIKPLEDFYERKSRNTTIGYCKKCTTKYHRDRLERIKVRMIQSKGGKCVRCSLSLDESHYSVFDFHHVNPKEKDINYKALKHQKWDFIQSELMKCILTCSNCHRMIHALKEKWNVQGQMEV